MSAIPNKPGIPTPKTATLQDDSDSEIIYHVVIIGNTMRRNTQEALILIQKYPDYLELLGSMFLVLHYVIIDTFDALKNLEPSDANYLHEHLASYAALAAYIETLKIILFHVQNIMRMDREEYKGILQRLYQIIGCISAQVEANIGKSGHLGIYLRTTVENNSPNLKIVEEFNQKFKSILTDLNDCGDELIRMKPEFGDGIGSIEVFSCLLQSGKIGFGHSIAVAQSGPVAFTFFSQLRAICNIASEIGDVIAVAHAAHKLWDAFIDPKDYEAYLQNTTGILPTLRSNIESLERVKGTYVDKGGVHGNKEETQDLQSDSHPLP